MPIFKTENLTIALFGEGESGKTTFISSFYGNQRTPEFINKYGYQIHLEDKQKSNELASIYFGMRDNKTFTDRTTEFIEYQFLFKTSSRHSDGIRFTINDYPGQWWDEEIPEKFKSDEAMMHLKNISSSDVGVMLIDGAKYLEHKEKYLMRLFDQFRERFHNIRCCTTEKISFPKIWIFAVTKSDLYDDDITASDFRDFIIRDASSHVNALFKDLFTNNDRYSLYTLKLSSVYALKGEIKDVNKFYGLHLMAPIVLKSALEKKTKRNKMIINVITFGRGANKKVSEIIEWVNNFPLFVQNDNKNSSLKHSSKEYKSFHGKKGFPVFKQIWQIISLLLILVPDLIERVDKRLELTQNRYDRKGKGFEACLVALVRVMKESNEYCPWEGHIESPSRQ